MFRCSPNPEYPELELSNNLAENSAGVCVLILGFSETAHCFGSLLHFRNDFDCWNFL